MAPRTTGGRKASLVVGEGWGGAEGKQECLLSQLHLYVRQALRSMGDETFSFFSNHLFIDKNHILCFFCN